MDTATIICDEGCFDFEFFENVTIDNVKKEILKFLTEENYNLKFPYCRCVINNQKIFVDLKGCK